MKISLINFDKETALYSEYISSKNTVDTYEIGESFDSEKYDTILIFFKSTYARAPKSVLKLVNDLHDAKIALVCVSKKAYDVNMVINKIIRKNQSLLIFSKNTNGEMDESIYDDLVNRKVVYDGHGRINKVKGYFTRLLNK